MELRKPLGQKPYGSIPHLPGSRLGKGDHHCHPGQAKIATEKVRDKHDKVYVQEKLDGSCCAVAKINGQVIALRRSGYLAESSEYAIYHIFAQWVEGNKNRFSECLNEGERLVGEFLAQAVGTRYSLRHEPFVAFDIMLGAKRKPLKEFWHQIKPFDFIPPRIFGFGEPLSIEKALKEISTSGHGAIDAVEGAIWRVERKGEFDFITKYVRHDKEDGKYFPENNNGQFVWNIDVSSYKLPEIMA
jgi:hypothetical protein